MLDPDEAALDNFVVNPRAPETPALRCARALIARERRALRSAEQAAQEARSTVERTLREPDAGPRPSRAVLFGSVVWGGFDPARSDVDLMVWGLDAEQAAFVTERLWQAVGRPVHLVRVEDAPASLTDRVEKEGVAVDVA